jgi:hypothetical protein
MTVSEGLADANGGGLSRSFTSVGITKLLPADGIEPL